jgi:uncharacterized protein YpuA (DUF1002 family)
MDAGTRQKRVEALEAIKNKAMDMAGGGKDSLEVRDFVTSAKKELAYELPDEDAFKKAMNATLAYKAKKGE